MKSPDGISGGLRVRVTKLKSDGRGFLVKDEHLECRREGVTGTIRGWVPGAGGDLWWVHHDDSEEIGAYIFTELEEI